MEYYNRSENSGFFKLDLSFDNNLNRENNHEHQPTDFLDEADGC